MHAMLICWMVSLGGTPPARPVGPIVFELPKEARPVMEKGRLIGHAMGLKTNPLTLLRTRQRDAVAARAIGPLAVDARFQPRNVTTGAAWESVRGELRNRMLAYFGKMPPVAAPLDVKVEQKRQDRQDHSFEVVSIAFSKDHRGRIGLLVPKGVPLPAAAIVLNDRWGGGIERASSGVYSRAIAAHFVRDGFVVAVINHWDDRFGDSRTLCTAGAATHMVLRTVRYLRTLKGLVDPGRIAYWGHVYGADLVPFIASLADDLACFVASCPCHAPVRPYTAAFWHPPFWARQGDNMGIATRTAPKMYYSKRTVETNPLPFLTQEIMALAAPRPFLAVNPDHPELFEAVRPVWGLYGKSDLLEVITHKWGTNEPVNAREYTVDFLLRATCGIEPGKATKELAGKIVAELRSGERDRQLFAARRAGWWRCRQAAGPLAKLVTSDDMLLRRAAAVALRRIGAMEEMIPHLTHVDPMVRLAAVEMMQVFGTEKAFGKLEKDDTDPDRWVNEAKWQTLQVNPWE
jgi:hypothetical protein